MFLELVGLLSKIEHGFNVLNYLTVRAVFSMLTAVVISLIFGDFFIKKMLQYKIVQQVRSDGPESHKVKKHTPTMGGVMILFSFILSIVVWSDWSNVYLWIIIATTIIFGFIGFMDDFLKIKKKSSKGLGAKQKYIYQSLAAILIIVWIINFVNNPVQKELLVPFLKGYALPLGTFGAIVLFYFVIVGSSNAVNLTDGLDGLAILPVVLITGALAVFAYISGHYIFSDYLNMHFISGSGELLVICAALIGSGLGFLWFNTYPAQIFMGDVGSLSLGAILAVIAIIIRQEIILFFMSGIFVVETLSVFIQVAYYKRFKKRIFLMAPIHHHFEKKGLSEPQISVRFWIITLFLVLISLASIKIR